MKFLKLIIIILIFCSQNVYSQNMILNGSFENNIANHSTCTKWWELSENEYDSLLNYSSAIFYSTNLNASHGIELIDSLCYGVEKIRYPQDSSWFISLNTWNFPSVPAMGNEGVTLELSTTLYDNLNYKISFYAYSSPYNNNSWNNFLVIGVSNDSNSLGTEVYRTIPDTAGWQNFEFDFVAPINAKHISVWVELNEIGQDLTFIDNFILTRLDSIPDDTNNINEQLTQAIEIYPNPFASQFIVKNKSSMRGAKQSVRLYDIYGKQQNVTLRQAQNDIQINTQSLSSGVYFVELWGIKNGQEVIVGRKKVVKN